MISLFTENFVSNYFKVFKGFSYCKSWYFLQSTAENYDILCHVLSFKVILLKQVRGDGQVPRVSKTDRNLSKTSSERQLSKAGSAGRNPMKRRSYRNLSTSGSDGSLARKGSAKSGSDRGLARSLPGRKGSAGPKRGPNPYSSQWTEDGSAARASGAEVSILVDKVFSAAIDVQLYSTLCLLDNCFTISENSF